MDAYPQVYLLESNVSFNYCNQTLNMFSNETKSFKNIIEEESYVLPNGFVISIMCLYGISFLVCIGGNVAVVCTIVSGKKLRTVTNLFLASLSLSDILMTVVCVPFTVLSNIIFHYWPFGPVMCPLVQYCQLVVVFQRAWVMIAVACDRHFVISRPMRKRLTKLKAKILLCLLWITATMTAVPIALNSEVIYLSYHPGPKGLCVELWEHHTSKYIYGIAVMLLQYVIPLIIMIIVYGHIGFIIWMKKVPGEPDVKRDKRVASSKRKSIMMLVALVIMYAIAWLPLHILTILGDINSNLYNYMSVHIMWVVFHFVAVSNSGINPFIYFYMNKSFRVGLTRLFKKMFCSNKIARNAHQRKGSMLPLKTFNVEKV